MAFGNSNVHWMMHLIIGEMFVRTTLLERGNRVALGLAFLLVRLVLSAPYSQTKTKTKVVRCLVNQK